MKLVLIIFGVIIFMTIVGGVISFLTIAVPAMRNAKPLTEEYLKICQKLIKEGKAYPYICGWAVKNGKCPCLPCEKLNNTKKLNIIEKH